VPLRLDLGGRLAAGQVSGASREREGSQVAEFLPDLGAEKPCEGEEAGNDDEGELGVRIHG
jgi:hypothetical protein